MDDVDVSALHRSIRCGGKRPRASPTRPMFPEGTYNTTCPPAIYVLSFLRLTLLTSTWTPFVPKLSMSSVKTPGSDSIVVHESLIPPNRSIASPLAPPECEVLSALSFPLPEHT